MHKLIVGLAAAATLGLPCAPALAGDDWIAVAPAMLEAQRGGFTTAAGLHIALGVERMVSINGVPVSQISLQASSAAGGPAQLIQLGANNAAGQLPELPGATFIQNSLNGLTIRTDTHISASVNSAALLRDLNFYHSLRDVALASGAR